jgi:MOSC domain-containing protein YiiM
VLEPGDVGAGDDVAVVLRPDHGMTLGQAFRVLTTEKHRLSELAPVLHFFPQKDQPGLAAKIAARVARTG